MTLEKDLGNNPPQQNSENRRLTVYKQHVSKDSEDLKSVHLGNGCLVNLLAKAFSPLTFSISNGQISH